MALLAAEQLETWLKASEDEHLEFKEAKSHFDFELLVKYCAALANEGGGKMVLGVTDKRPRRVVGSHAFADVARTKAGLMERLHLRITAEVIPHPSGPVVVIQVPSRPLGAPVDYKGAYWMRRGEDLVPMTPDMLKRIFDELVPDFSAEVRPGATLADLDPAAVRVFRDKWRQHSSNEALLRLSDEQLLADAELVVNGGVTYAALVLFGTHRALGQHLAQAEVIFEYRSSEASIPSQQRVEHREAFFLFFDTLWNTINLRNEVQEYFDGPYRREVKTFNETVVREAILNAVSHREYRLPGSVFVRQFPRKLEIVSPGGFPTGVTPQNILWTQAPRNRRIAEAFARCGLVERAGQGMDRIYEHCIKESKPQPDYTHTDEYHVWVTLHCDIQDPQFIKFLEKVGRERETSFSTQDLLVLDLVHREQPVPAHLQPYRTGLVEQGVVEAIGRGRGVRHLLSRPFYSFIGQPGAYTRKRGLDRETNKALLLRHIEDSGDMGVRFEELTQVLPALSTQQIRWLLELLKKEERIHNVGRTRNTLWFPGPCPVHDPPLPQITANKSH